MTTRILLADNQEVIRDFLAALIDSQPGMEVVGEASNGRDALILTRKLRPDVVIMDINMPMINGFEVTLLIVNEFPGLKVLSLANDSNCQNIEDIFKLGAAGFLLKDQIYEELVQAIHVIIDNRVYVSSEIHCSSPLKNSPFSVL